MRTKCLRFKIRLTVCQTIYWSSWNCLCGVSDHLLWIWIRLERPRLTGGSSCRTLSVALCYKNYSIYSSLSFVPHDSSTKQSNVCVCGVFLTCWISLDLWNGYRRIVMDTLLDPFLLWQILSHCDTFGLRAHAKCSCPSCKSRFMFVHYHYVTNLPLCADCTWVDGGRDHRTSVLCTLKWVCAGHSFCTGAAI